LSSEPEDVVRGGLAFGDASGELEELGGCLAGENDADEDYEELAR
jgi:hypothetical protein